MRTFLLIACVAAVLALALRAFWPSAARPAVKVLAEPHGHFPFSTSDNSTSSDRSASPADAPGRPAAEPVDACSIDPNDKSLDSARSSLAAAFAARTDEAAAALAERIAADPDPYAHAIGELLHGQDELVAASAASAAASTIAQLPLRSNPALDAVVKEASTSGDPRLYALAFTTYQVTSVESCAALSAAQWTRLDPGNAAPWLFVLDAATAHGDGAAIDDALFHIARSKRLETRFHASTSVVADRADTSSDVGASAAMAVTMKAVGIQGLASILPFQATTKACNGPAIAAAITDRRQLCEQIAELLSEHSDDLIATMIGSTMGRRLGWPEDRADAIRGLSIAARDAWQEGSTVDARSLSPFVGCSTLRTQMARLQSMAQLGEPDWARDFMRRSGRSASTYAEKARTMRLQFDAQMQSASSASAASVAH